MGDANDAATAALEEPDEGEALLARLNRLQEAMERHTKEAREAAEESEDEEEYASDDFEELGEDDAEDGEDIGEKAGGCTTAAAGEDGHSASSAKAAAAAAKRRRRLDQTWQVEAERDFEARTSEDAAAPDAGRGEAIAAELRSHAELQELPGPPLPTPGESCEPAPEQVKSTLRRLKQVESDVAIGVEKECGVNLGRGVDVFRLVLQNPQSSLRSCTRVLLVQAGEAFLCEEPISEEGSVEPDSTAGGASSSARSGEAAATAACADADQGVDSGRSWVDVELRYFRAAPKRGSLAQRLGRVPTLHVTFSMDDGTHQAMEFIGVHQRRYYAEDPPSDAISRNLTESLLRVALEFVFHPSRSRFSKDRVTLRECSVDSEALHSREALLPRMVDGVRQINDKIGDVHLEFRDPHFSARLPCREGPAGRKDKSFLVLDEDVLKVSPAKEQFSAKAPSAKGAFKGLGQGFLNSAKVKSKGLGGTKQAGEAQPGAQASASSSPAQSAEGASTSISDQIPAGERTRINPLPEGASQPAPVETSQAEKQQLLLPAAEPAPGEAYARAVAASLREPQAEAADEEIDEEEGGPATLSELANQLFGLELDELDSQQSQHTESTDMPSPMAASSRDGGALSEHSESATEAQPAATAPLSGVRLLQQRRREREAMGRRDAGSGNSQPAESSQQAAAPSRAADNPDDLVALWMKQRW